MRVFARFQSNGYNKVTVEIQYCGGWNYGPQFEVAQGSILDEYRHDSNAKENIEIIGIKDLGKTGNFEISVNGNLVHSKRTKGDGFLNHKTKKSVIDAINNALKSKQ